MTIHPFSPCPGIAVHADMTVADADDTTGDYLLDVGEQALIVPAPVYAQGDCTDRGEHQPHTWGQSRRSACRWRTYGAEELDA